MHGKAFSEFPPEANPLTPEKAARLFQNLHVVVTGSIKWPNGHVMLPK
jgi:hypothetical protein